MTSRNAVVARESFLHFEIHSRYIDARCIRAEPQDERAPSAGAKSLAIPFGQERWPTIEKGKTLCPACGKPASRWTMFGRSYCELRYLLYLYARRHLTFSSRM